jgi:hypothetical protein
LEKKLEEKLVAIDNDKVKQLERVTSEGEEEIMAQEYEE